MSSQTTISFPKDGAKILTKFQGELQAKYGRTFNRSEAMIILVAGYSNAFFKEKQFVENLLS